MDPSLGCGKNKKWNKRSGSKERGLLQRGNRNKEFYKEEFSYDVYYRVFGKMLFK